MVREMLKPQTLDPAGKLRLLNGIANSATHPFGVRLVRTSQMASQSVFRSPFANARPSTSVPAGFVAK